MDSLIATARSNKVSTCLGIQDFSQLRKDYGREQADVIMNITGNIVAGQVTGDTAKQLYERFGKMCRTGKAFLLTAATLPSAVPSNWNPPYRHQKYQRLVLLSLWGWLPMTPDCKIDLKAFHCEILNDREGLKKEQDHYKDIEVIRKLDTSMVNRNYLQVKQDIDDIIRFEMERLMNDPGQAHLIIQKKK